MSEELQVIYQSNEPVKQGGSYAVVGSVSTGPLSLERPAHVIVHFTEGETFPNYEGRAVCWRLVEEDQDASN